MRRGARGFSLLAIMFVVAAIGIGAGAAMESWRTSMQREREAELIHVGREFREAIRGYFESGRQYPESLESLVKDPRSQLVRRYLRRIYPDPVTGKSEWGLVVLNEKIVGVASLSEAAPLKVDGFDPTEASFKDKERYSQWRFTHPADLAATNLQVRPWRPAATPQPGS